MLSEHGDNEHTAWIMAYLCIAGVILGFIVFAAFTKEKADKRYADTIAFTHSGLSEASCVKCHEPK